MPASCVDGSSSGWRDLYLLDFTAERRHAGPVEDLGSSVANFLHGQVYATDSLIRAIGAAHVSGLAGTRNWCKRPIENSDDLTEVDLGGIPSQAVASALSLSALQDPMISQAQQNQLQELGRDLLGSC